ncbi:MAG: hypothetical protein LC657_10020 [Desulfobacteraceae bacterium]|nr:hypothetical protein [Desulfobacteraceae bacterium]
MKRLLGLPFWILCVVSACCGILNVRADPAQSSQPHETHTYIEQTGTAVKQVTWTLEKKDTFTLTYLSPQERHVTTTSLDYDTRRWDVTEKKGPSDFTAVRTGKAITISGRFRGDPVNKTLEIDDTDWYQASSLSLRGLVVSAEREKTFWTIRSDTLTVHKLKAVKQGLETVEVNGAMKEAVRIELSLTGLLSPFWKSDYWFSVPEGIFLKFQGPSGPPGSPVTTITRVQ